MTARQRPRLRQLRHDPRLRPRERDRVEMCLLSAQGWTTPHPGGASGCVCGHDTALDPAVGGPRPEVSALCAHGASRWEIRAWAISILCSMRAWGIRSCSRPAYCLQPLLYARMGHPPAVAQRQQVFRALRRCLRRPQVWSSRTLSAGPGDPGSASAAAHSAQVPAADGSQLPAHQVLSAAQTGPGTGGGGSGRVAGAQEKARDGHLRLFYLDESGFAPSLPPTYTWSRPGHRPHIPHENTEGRRVNVVAALAAPGPTPTEPLTWGAAARTWKSADARDFLLYRLPRGGGPTPSGGAGQCFPATARRQCKRPCRNCETGG